MTTCMKCPICRRNRTLSGLPFQLSGAEFQPVQAGGSFYMRQRGHVIWVREVFQVKGAIAAALLGSTAAYRSKSTRNWGSKSAMRIPGCRVWDRSSVSGCGSLPM